MGGSNKLEIFVFTVYFLLEIISKCNTININKIKMESILVTNSVFESKFDSIDKII